MSWVWLTLIVTPLAPTRSFHWDQQSHLWTHALTLTMAKKRFYAVKRGRQKGIFKSWPECQAQVSGFPGAVFKGFATLLEANEFIADSDIGIVFSAQSSSDPNTNQAIPVSQNTRKHISNAQFTCSSQSNIQNDNHSNYEHAPNIIVNKRQRQNDDTNKTKPSRIKLVSENEVAEIHMTLHFDGGSKGNNGQLAGAGAKLVVNEIGPLGSGPQSQRVIEMRESLTKTANTNNTNNVAEYAGLIIGLKEVIVQMQSIRKRYNSKFRVKVHIFGDSKLVINQMKGQYQCKSENIKKSCEEAKRLVKQLKDDYGIDSSESSIEFEHVYRDQNRDADRLANEAMDQKRSWQSVTVTCEENDGDWV